MTNAIIPIIPPAQVSVYPTSMLTDLGQEGQKLKMKEIKLIFNTIFITFIMFLVIINIFMDFDKTVQPSGQIFTKCF